MSRRRKRCAEPLPIEFDVEVVSEGTMQVVMYNMPEADLMSVLTAPVEQFVALADAIKRRAAVGWVAGHG